MEPEMYMHHEMYMEPEIMESIASDIIKEKMMIFLSQKYNRLIIKSRYKKNSFPTELSSSSSVENCSICLTSLINKRVLLTPCQHVFHYNCIMRVYNSNTQSRYNCPLCRASHSDCLKQINFGEELNIIEQAAILLNSNHIPINSTVILMPLAELLVFIETVIDIIQISFTPDCFRRMIESYPSLSLTESIICPTCNLIFRSIVYPSYGVVINYPIINNHSFQLIHQYLINYPTIINLINDVLMIINFETKEELVSYIYQEYESSYSDSEH
jgi:hypothetical protein